MRISFRNLVSSISCSSKNNLHLKQVKIDQGEELRKVCTAGICVIKQIMGICPYTLLQRTHLIKINVFNENQFSSEIFGQYRETEKEGICKLVF